MNDQLRSTNGFASESPARPAGTSRFRRLRLILFNALVVIFADQLTKWIVETNMALYESIPVIGHWFGFTRTQNFGAAFSMLQNGGIFFVIVAAVVTGVILYYGPRLPEHDWVSRVALGLQLGGALGNVIDRIRQGYVTDFLHIKIPEIGFDWPVSNIADVCIVSGVIILIITSLRGDQAASNQQTSQPAP